MAMPVDERSFVAALVPALNLLNVEVTPQFCVPGTSYKIDLFVPSVPRAAIEVTNGSSLDDLARFREIQKAFADRLLLFLVWLGDRPPSHLWNEIQQNAFLFFIPVAVSRESLGQVIVETAKTISDTLQNVRESRYRKFWSPIKPPMSVKEAPEGYGDLDTGAPAELRQRLFSYGVGRGNVPTRNTTIALLRTLKDLLPSERYSVLEHELKQLEEEFSQSHFTACALRAGRSLELIVYGAAKAWGVRLDDPVFNLIEDLQQRLQLMNSAILDYRESEVLEREAKRGVIQTRGSEFAARLTSLGFLLDDHKLQPSAVPPRNVDAILRDIRKTHGKLPQVREEIKSLLDSGVVRKILGVRNDAAHASLEGGPREVSEETVIAMLQDIQTLVHKLSVVGDIIASAGDL